MNHWAVMLAIGAALGAFVTGYGFVSRFATVDAVTRVEAQTHVNTTELARRADLIMSLPDVLRDMHMELAAINVRLARIDQRLRMGRDP